MTNILAFVIVTICTNWTQIGTFTPKSGGVSSKVEEGRVLTNTTAIFTWNGAKKEFILNTKEGPVVGERKTFDKTSNVIVFQTNTMMLTNMPLNWVY
jgi:hypothetical protein